MSAQELLKLYQLQWLSLSAPELSPGVRSWLFEELSMTTRLESYCQSLTVDVLREGFIDSQSLLAHEAGDCAFDHQQRYWLREVMLSGDNVPWLMGRTILPESTLTGRDAALTSLGECPLGRYLFSSPLLSRDFIRPGKNDDLWGRYSLLRLSGKPLMLTEIFLPSSPLYQDGVKG